MPCQDPDLEAAMQSDALVASIAADHEAEAAKIKAIDQQIYEHRRWIRKLQQQRKEHTAIQRDLQHRRKLRWAALSRLVDARRKREALRKAGLPVAHIATALSKESLVIETIRKLVHKHGHDFEFTTRTLGESNLHLSGRCSASVSWCNQFVKRGWLTTRLTKLEKKKAHHAFRVRYYQITNKFPMS